MNHEFQQGVGRTVRLRRISLRLTTTPSVRRLRQGVPGAQAVCSTIDLTNIPASIIQLLPTRCAREYLAVPVRIEEDTVIIAVADPINLDLLSRLQFAVGGPVRLVGADSPSLHLAIDHFYPDEGEEIIECVDFF